jgi:hypothetical protein
MTDPQDRIFAIGGRLVVAGEVPGGFDPQSRVWAQKLNG